MKHFEFWRINILESSKHLTGSLLEKRVDGFLCVRLAAIVFLTLAVPLNTFADPTLAKVVSFDIPSQRADLALIFFAEQADRTLLFSYDIAVKSTSNQLVGQYSVIEGLDLLLTGTGLYISMGDDGQLSVVDQLTGDVEMTTDKARESPAEGPDAGLDVASAEDDQLPDRGINSKPTLETITVTARKRQEALQDIPTSATALSRQFLDDMGVLPDLRSLTDLVAGISINDTNLAFITEPTLRGAGAGRNRMSVSATGLFRNRWSWRQELCTHG